ncbi:MAG: hypothetical protein KBD63_06530 [Bacteriovoracaceae bacterium]|nr:hypothetical protein [Bacteriovoracaceae bacterium]
MKTLLLVLALSVSAQVMANDCSAIHDGERSIATEVVKTVPLATTDVSTEK